MGVTIGKQLAYMDWDHRRRWRQIRLDITGLTAGDNVIPHGLTSLQGGAVTIERERIAHFRRPGTSDAAGRFHESLLHRGLRRGYDDQRVGCGLRRAIPANKEERCYLI